MNTCQNSKWPKRCRFSYDLSTSPLRCTFSLDCSAAHIIMIDGQLLPGVACIKTAESPPCVSIASILLTPARRSTMAILLAFAAYASLVVAAATSSPDVSVGLPTTPTIIGTNPVPTCVLPVCPFIPRCCPILGPVILPPFYHSKAFAHHHSH